MCTHFIQEYHRTQRLVEEDYSAPCELCVFCVSACFYTHTQTHKHAHTLASMVHTCCCNNLGVNKGFLLRFNDVFTPSVSLIVTQNRGLAQGSDSELGDSHLRAHSHTLTRTCYSKSLTLAWQSVSIRVGKVSHTVNMDFTSSFLTFTPSSCVCKKSMHIKGSQDVLNRNGSQRRRLSVLWLTN